MEETQDEVGISSSVLKSFDKTSNSNGEEEVKDIIVNKRKRFLNPSRLDMPSYLLNFPASFDTHTPNNVWMENIKPENIIVDDDIALAQWIDLYNFISAQAFVSVLPTPKYARNLQDLVYCGNLVIVLPHLLPERTVAVIANMEGIREGETKVGKEYFEMMGYDEVIVPPYIWDGEAMLKHLHDNVYVGGYGLRGHESKVYHWFEEQFDMKIIKIEMSNPKQFHLDCSIFPLTGTDTMVATKEYTEEEIKNIEKETNIIDVPSKYADTGVCNNVRLNNLILNSSDIYDLDPILDKDDYRQERDKNRFLEDIVIDFGFEVAFINLSEYAKGGGMLSCLVAHLNYDSYKISLV